MFLTCDKSAGIQAGGVSSATPVNRDELLEDKSKMPLTLAQAAWLTGS
jgi:hypothetical protein